MRTRDRQLGWIGVISGFTGVVIANAIPLDALLPVNQILFVLVCTLMVVWLLASAIPSEGERP